MEARSKLRHRNLINISGGYAAGCPFFAPGEIARALEDGRPSIRKASGDPDSRPALLAELVREECSHLAGPDAILSFLRDGRDNYLLTVKRLHAEGEGAFLGRLAILEPLAVTVSKRRLVRAEVEIAAGPSGALLRSVEVPLLDERNGEPLTSYPHLVLLDKLLAWLIAPERQVDPAEIDYAG